MAQEIFEGDLSEISSRQLEYISEVLNEKGYKDAKVTIKPVGVAGDNYVANVKRITAEKDGECLKIVAKVAPKIEQLRMTMNTRNIFLNEHTMYTEVLQKFTELEKTAGVAAEERLRYAACYGTLIEDCEELILLEDLVVSGFTMLDRFKPLTNNDIQLVLQSFAKLHSLSYVLKYQEPETYTIFSGKLVDIWKMFYENEQQEKQVASYFQSIEDDCISICDQKYTNIIKGTASETMQLARELNSFDDDSRFSVIQQGDSWTNNILFKLQEGKSVSCCMIDYQLSRINSPAADLQYMFFNCTDHETRQQYFLEWMDYYHSELEKCLKRFGLEVYEVYPRDQLDADMKRHVKMSIATTMQLASILCREQESAQEFKTALETMNMEDMDQMIEVAKASNLDEKTISLYRSRVEGVLETCLQFGLL